MRFLRDYICLVARAWWGWLAGGSLGLVGVVLDAFPSIQIPLWAWAIILMAGLIVAQFQIYYRDHAIAEPTPDWRLSDVIKYLVGKENIWEAVSETGGAASVNKHLMDIEQKLRLGSIQTWARPHCPEGNELSQPYARVEPDHWADYQFDFLGFVKNDRGESIGRRQSVLNGRCDFFFNRAQVQKLWPRKRKKLRFRLPVARES